MRTVPVISGTRRCLRASESRRAGGPNRQVCVSPQGMDLPHASSPLAMRGVMVSWVPLIPQPSLSPIYTPSPDDLGCKLKVTCTPFREEDDLR